MAEKRDNSIVIVIHLGWFPIQTCDHVFTDILLDFDRVFNNGENRSVLENTDLLLFTEKRSVFPIRTSHRLKSYLFDDKFMRFQLLS